MSLLTSLDFHLWFRRVRRVLLGCWLLPLHLVAAPYFISEIFVNPPGIDSPNEYIELRGPANAVLPAGSYLLSLEGDAAGNPGTIQDLFDLSGRSFGPNGFLLLLQKGSAYVPAPLSHAYTQNGSDPGWGHGNGSSLKHRGEEGQTDLENPSLTFLLISTTASPSIGDDVDVDNDGVIDAEFTSSWTIYDSIGVLDGDGAGDVAYGKANFRRAGAQGSGALALGTVIPVTFTPSYIARHGNSSGYAATDWIASDSLPGVAPAFALADTTHTWPASLAGALLNHFGGPNFGAPQLPGVVVSPLDTTTSLSESGGTNHYSLALVTVPSVPVSVEVQADPGLVVSSDQGKTFSSKLTVLLGSLGSREIWVRTVQNSTVEISPRSVVVKHRILPASDPAYLDAIVPSVSVSVLDDDELLLSEVLVNPVGSDEGKEYVELVGEPGALLRGVYLLAVESNAKNNLGSLRLVVDLSGVTLGSNGVLFLATTPSAYSIPPATTFLEVPQLGELGGGLANDSFSLILITTSSTPKQGQDWDDGDNGILEGLPKNATVLDSIAWLDGDPEARAYGTLLSNSGEVVPDAATRFPGDHRARNSDAWFFGDLKTSDAPSLRYDRSLSSSNLPPAAVLTPGVLNNTPPQISKIEPISGSIGDPTNPQLSFTVSDAESGSDQLTLIATSSNPEVIAESGISLKRVRSGEWTLQLHPIGVGYASIVIQVSDGGLTDQSTLHYAASNDGNERTRFMMGAGDGSTAIPLPGNLVLIGDDENETIRLYDRTKSSLPLAGYDMTPFLGLTDIENGSPREVDIEGSTRVGDRLFWLGAHSHSGLAESRTNRSRVFATDLVKQGEGWSLKYVGRYDYLKADLVNWDHGNSHGKGADHYGFLASTAEGVDPKAVDGSGFNLEGLTMAPGSDQVAYIAFRAPLVPASRRTHALIVPVLNFASLAASNGRPNSAIFGKPIEIDLFGRGIRSIEGTGGHYLVVAGPAGFSPGTYPNDFRLYHWSGNPLDAPKMFSTPLSGLNPEGIVELPTLPWTPTREVQLLSDCGTRVWYGDGIETKLLQEVNFKKCRLDWVPLGDEIVPPPVILSVTCRETSATVRWRGTVGQRYRVQWTDDLRRDAWDTLAGEVLAADVFVEATYAVPSEGQRYFRVLIVP